MFTRPFLAYPGVASTLFIGSTAGGATLIASNANRVALSVQALTDAFRIGPNGSMTASSGLLVASGAIVALPPHAGALYALPNGGATAAIALWESQS